MNPVTIGPTWQRDAEGEYILPKYSLGFYLSSVWAPRWINQPDGPQAGQPWSFTKEQARFLAWWYAVDEDGHFLYRSGVFRRMKGAGKNPFAMAIALCEFLGPCRFSGKFGANGQPIGEPHYASWVQMAAVSRDQTRNSTGLLVPMISQDAKREFGIDIGIDETYAHGKRCRLQAITSSPATVEGGRATFIVMDETHHWKGNNEGHAMADVIARNVAKSRGGEARALAITNAHAIGQDSVAERAYEAWRELDQAGGESDFLYDSLEAPEIDFTDDEELRAGIEAARGGADWLAADRLIAEIRDPRTSEALARRFYLNQVFAEEDRPFDKEKFRELIRPNYIPADGAIVVMGFDGSLTRDHTALIGTEVATGHQWVVGYWVPRIDRDGEVRIPFMEVDQAVDAAFERWDVWRLNADPYKWGQLIDTWMGRYGDDRIVKWSTTSLRKMAFAVQNYVVAINTSGITHDGDPRLMSSVENCHKQMLTMRDDDQNLLYVLEKERPASPLKIDAAIAAVLSLEAQGAAVAAGVLEEEIAGVMFV